ncbi:MAG: hypothetical protein LAN59_02205 [Acidobacteriia bacterium]|nr:hypothetical protein [Terriglobia bacterium]
MSLPIRSSVLLLLCLFSLSRDLQAQEDRTPVVISVRMARGSAVYRVDKTVVENTRENSLLTNLEAIASAKGLDWPIIILVDVNAPLREVDKLETAVAKIDFHNHRLFVGDFHRGVMEELHWGQASVPIPMAAR